MLSKNLLLWKFPKWIKREKLDRPFISTLPYRNWESTFLLYLLLCIIFSFWLTDWLTLYCRYVSKYVYGFSNFIYIMCSFDSLTYFLLYTFFLLEVYWNSLKVAYSLDMASKAIFFSSHSLFSILIDFFHLTFWAPNW